MKKYRIIGDTKRWTNPRVYNVAHSDERGTIIRKLEGPIRAYIIWDEEGYEIDDDNTGALIFMELCELDA